MVPQANQFGAPADQHPLQKPQMHQPQMQMQMEPQMQQQKHPTQQIVTHPTQQQQHPAQHDTHAPHMVNQRDDSDLMKQRERPKPRRKGKYRDVSNPSTSSHMNQGPSHETKKYTPKARKSELEEG